MPLELLSPAEYPADTVMGDTYETRLPVGEVREMHILFNVNLSDSELHDTWLDHDPTPTDAELTEVGPEYFFEEL